MVTIYDIALKTGFSAPTISKALNGTGGLSKSTRKKILTVAEELGYRPNMAARSLTTKKSFLIGIIFEDIDMQRGFEHPLFGGILNRLRMEIEVSGYDLIFLSHLSMEKRNSYVEHCRYRNIDVCVVINPVNADKSIMELASSGIPCVSTNFVIPGIPTVITANKEAGYNAASYFIRNGHKKIAYISGSYTRYNVAALDRLEGLRQAEKEFGLQYDESYVEYCPQWTRECGYKAMKSLLGRHKDITAVFVSSDNMAVGAMEYAKSAGMKIPEDISFIGFDDEMFSEFYSPPITTFRQNRTVIGELAAEILMNRIAGIPVSECVLIPADFIIRSSVKNMHS
ncbi:MAG: LacI family DNA-binding transcriptional regulator [Treponema sp.]|nr:LacI family DNA-binding transcriptional regulator [Treponema sp.]